ncbi:LOW QUALITY PROTEIN: Protein CBR-IFG-1, partial [Caenorhabditis briggsae]
MSNAVSRGPPGGRGKPNQNHNAGGVPDQGQQFVMPVVPQQGQGYQRYQQNQMQQQGYQQPYQQQYQHQQYQQYQPHSQAPPYQQHAQPPQPLYSHQPHMYNQSYQYRAPPQQYMQDTVTFPQPSQPPMTAPAPAEKRQRKLLEIVDPNTKKAIEVTPLQTPTAPVIPAVPLDPEDEKKKAELSHQLKEQVRQRFTSTNTDDGHQSKSPNLQGSGPLPNFSQPPPSISSSHPVAEVVPEVTQPAPKTPDAQTKVEAGAPPAEPVTPVSSPQSSETTNTTPASGTAESAVAGHEARVTPTLQKEESKEEDDDDKFDEVDRNETPDLTESQIEKTPEELEEEKAQKEAEEKEKRRIREESLEKKLEELVASGDANIEKGYFARDFMITMRALEKEFARTPCPLSQQQLNDFGLDIKTMQIPQNKKTNFTPQWMPNNKGNRQQNPYRGRTTTDGTGRGGQQQRDRGGHNKRPPPVRASIERIPRVTLASSKDAWKPDRQKTAEDISAEEAAVKEVCKKVRSLMNKVTPTSQGPLTAEFISYNVSSNESQLTQVVGIVFDKAVEEPKFCALYAEMCKAQVTHELAKSNGKSAFRNTILTRTQSFFQDKRDIDAEKLAVIEKEEDPVKREAMLIEEKQKFRRRKFGVMAFIGYLYRNNLLSTKIVQSCSLELFASILPKKIDEKEQLLNKEDFDEESIHCGLQLIETVGVILDKSKDPGPAFLDQWFKKLEDAKPLCSNKIRFMIMNLNELRKDKWVPRKSVESGPKKIDEIHKDIRQEKIDNEKARDQYDRDRDRRHGGGVRQSSNSLRKQVPVSRNSLDRNRAPDQKRAQAAANTKLASSNVQPKNITLSSAIGDQSLRTKTSWSGGASGGGNAAESTAAPAAAGGKAWGRRDSNDQRKKSAIDEKQASLAAAREIGNMTLSARRSASQTSIPDKVDEGLTDEEKALRAKIMNSVKSDIQEVVSEDLSQQEMADSFSKDYVGSAKYGNPSLTVVYEMIIRAVSEKNMKEEERKKLACVLRMSLVSDAAKQSFIDGVTRFCKFAIDTELYQDFPQIWNVTGEVLMNTMHVHHEVIGDSEVKTISLTDMKSAFLTAKIEKRDNVMSFVLFVEVIKRWTDAEIAETGAVEALAWEFQDLPYREKMEKEGLRTEMDTVKASNGKTLSSLLS